MIHNGDGAVSFALEFGGMKVVIGPNVPPPPDRTVPEQLSKWCLQHRWDISKVSAEMVKEFKKKHNMK